MATFLRQLVSVALLFVCQFYMKAQGQAPAITSVSPSQGPVGTTLTIKGTNFNATAGSSLVFFGGVVATVTEVFATTLTVNVPAGATYGPLRVLNSATGLVGTSATYFTPTYSPHKGSIGAQDMASKVDYPLGNMPYSVALGDMDGNGKLDVVTANYHPNTISVLRNTGSSGSPSFAAKIDYPVGTGPLSVTLGDVDGNGKLDVVTANNYSNTISVLRNTSSPGNLSFATKVDYLVGNAPRSVALGDVDGDGKLDILVTNSSLNTISVFRNTGGPGSISFATKVDYSVGNGPIPIALGDVDDDGRPDVVVGNTNSNTISILRNTGSAGSASFAAKVDYPVGFGPLSATLGDLDGNGKLDVVVGNLNSNNISVLRNIGSPGNPSFAAKVDYVAGNGPVPIVLGDVDGDGKPDMVVGNVNSGNISVLRNTGSPGSLSFATKVDYTVGSTPASIALGDVDDDGKPDLVAANLNSNNFSILRNTPQLSPDANGILYVKKGSTGTGNSWANALGELADALKFAKTNNANVANAQVSQIWVAKGTYKPLYSPADNNFGNPDGRKNAFLLVRDVKIYGGFAGTESTSAARDLSLAANKSTLSGDFNDNDLVSGSGAMLNITGNAENAYHVLLSVGLGGSAELNGFTISGGNANDLLSSMTVSGEAFLNEVGGGMYNASSSAPQISQCNFLGNSATNGGGMYNETSSAPQIDKCSFSKNYAEIGGGMNNYLSSPIINNSNFWGNSAQSGGGMYNNVSSPKISNASFIGNNAYTNGGGMKNYTSAPKIRNSRFLGNNADFGGVAIEDASGTGTLLINVTVYGNTATGSNASVVYVSGGGVAIQNSIIWDNQGAQTGGAGITFGNSLVQGSATTANGNLDATGITTAQLFVDPDGTDNILGTDDDDVTLKQGSPAIGAASNNLYEAADGNANNNSLATDTDLNGNPRLKGNTIDMGAYESPYGTITPDSSGILYVKKGSTGAGDSWANALGELADALKFAKTNNANTANAQVSQIWVAGGTYKPLYSPADNNFGNADGRNNAFLLVKDVKIYGGFAGAETSLAQRDLSIVANKSILSGDIDNNDVQTNGASTTINGNNAYHIMFASGNVGAAELNGFTLTGGRANGTGAIIVNGNSLLRHYGGAMLNISASPIINNCAFVNNIANSIGGAMLNNNASPSIKASTFTGNTASTSGGGAMYNSGGSPVIVGCLFTGNRAPTTSGGALWQSGGTITFVNCSIYGNSANGGNAGGIYAVSAIVNLDNTLLWGNAGPQYALLGGTVNVQYSLIQGSNSTSNGNIDATGITTPQIFTDAPNGDFSLATGSPAQNKGNNALYTNAGGNLATDEDLAGNPRLTGTNIDLGAYEVLSQPQTITANNQAKTYGDVAFEPGATASSGLTVAYASADNTIAEAFQDAADGNKWKLNIKKAGTVNVTASQGGGSGFDPASDVVFSLTINKKPVTVSVKPAAAFSKVYDANTAGTFQTSDLMLASGDIINNDDVQLNLSSGTAQYNTKEVGSGKTITFPIANVLLSGAQAGNYNIANIADLSSTSASITPKPLTITANNATKVYDGFGYNGGNGVSYGTFALGEDPTVFSGTLAYGGTAQGAINTGTYTIVPSGLSSPNYTITYVNGQLNISLNSVNTLAFNAQTTGSTVTKTYGDADINASAIASSGLTASYQSSNAAVATVNASGQVTLLGTGTTTITVNQAGDANYGPANPIAFQVQVAKKMLTVTANDFSKTYNGVAYSGGNGVSYNGFATGETATVLSGTLAYGGSSQGAVNTGIYVIAPGGLSSANYDFDYKNGALSIVPSGANVITFNSQVTGATQQLTYGSGVIDASAIASSGLTVNYTSSNPAVASVNTAGQVQILAAGTATITASQPGDVNHTAAVSISFNINVQQKALTITANNFNKTYDGQIYSTGSGVSYNGFVNGENEQNLQGALSYAGTAIGAKGVGSYFISPTGYTSNNYAITYQDGSLTITKASLTINATAKTKIYGDADPALTYISNGLIGADAISGTPTRTAGENVGSYAIDQGTLDAGANYSIVFNPSNLAITARTLTIAATAKSKTYGDADPALTYASTGLVGADVITGALVRATGENVGTYLISQGSLTAGGNYNITYVPSNLAITARPLTITAQAKNKVYGDADPTLTYASTGLVGADVITGSLTRATGENVGTYLISQGSLTAGGNYNITYVPSNLAITARPLTITAQAKNKVYGDADPALTYTSTGLTGTDVITGSLARVVGENVGIYAIAQGTLSSSTNYIVTYNSANLTITKALLTITANNKMMCQNSNLPVLDVSYSGFKNNDTENSLGIKPTVTANANSNSLAGTYVLAPAGAIANNYSFSYVNGSLVINPLPIVAISSSKGNSVSKGETLSLMATGGNTYTWANANGIISGQNTAVLNIRPSQTTTYTVTATNASGCSQSSSITIEVRDDFQAVKANNILTPNGDGINDLWVVDNIDAYPNNVVQIFDRAGRVLFTKKGYNNTWDGTVNGQVLAEGTYYYIIDFGTNKLKQKGFITLIRQQ